MTSPKDMTFEEAQRRSMTDINRSSFSHEPPGFNRASRRLDQIAQAQAEALHVERQRKRAEALSALAEMDADLIDYETKRSIRQSSADMADLIEHARQGEFKDTQS
jgi:hypothetical protein